MIQKILHRLLGDELDAKVKQYFLKGSFAAVLLQISLSLLTFLTTIVVARLTGDRGFGIYTLVFTWVGIISAAAVMGLDDLAIRQMPLYKAKQNNAEANAFLRWGTKMALLSAFCFSGLYISAVFLLPLPGLQEYKSLHLIAAVSIPFFVLIYFFQAVLRGWGNLAEGQLADKVIQPLTFLALLFIFFIIGYSVSDQDAVIFRVLSFIVALVALFIILIRKLSPLLKEKATIIKGHIWYRSLFYFTASTLLYAINTRIDIVFLGVFQIRPENIAYYNVALKFSDIALIPFLVICTVTTPMFATLYHEGKIIELQAFYTKVTRLTTVVISAILLIFVIFGPWFLSWYGTSFSSAYEVLVLLCITKFVHVFVGPANYLLSMIGKEKQVTIALVYSVLITIILHLLLIPILDIRGAAYATLGGLLFFDLYLALSAYRTSGLWLSALGKIVKKRN